MTTKTLKDYLTAEAKMAKLEDDIIDTRVALAVKFGIADFWTSYRWNFRVNTANVTITGGSTIADQLPKNFGAMKSISETDSSQGWNLDFLEKEKFDEMFPKPLASGNDIPTYFTIYFNEEEKRFYIQLYRVPSSSIELPMTYYSKAPEEAEFVPDGYESGLIPSCVKYLYKWGTVEQVAVARAQFLAIQGLIKRDAVTYRKLKTLAYKIKEPMMLYKERYVDSWLR